MVRGFGLERWTGAAAQSQTPTWQRFLQATRGGRAGPEPGSDEDTLRRAEASHESARAVAESVGVPGGGAPDPGLLSSAARALDLPGAVVRSGVRELLNVFDPEASPSLAAFRENVDQRALAPDLFPGLFRAEDDDPAWLRVLRGAGSFATEVATDPLTYVSLGGSVVGKRAASEAVQRTVNERAGRFLGDDAASRWADASRRGQTAQALARQADEVPAEVAGAVRRLAGEAGQFDRVAVGRAHIGDAAAEAYQLGGARGLRRWLTDEFGDAGARLWETLPRDIQGGVRIRVPFAYDEGVRRTHGVAGGGGRFADALGLGATVERTHAARNRLRASALAQRLSTALGGTHGDLYGKMVADLVEHGAQRGATFSAYRAVVESADVVARFGTELSDTAVSTIHRAGLLVDGAPDPKRARASFEDWFGRPADLDELRRTSGLEVDEVGRFHVRGGVQGLSDDEVRGAAGAMVYHDTINALADAARREGLTIRELDEYVPRLLADAAPERLRRGVTAGTRTPGPGRERRMFVETEDGVRWVHLTPQEVNERVGFKLFSESPDAMLAGYLGALQTLTVRQRFYNLLRDSGTVVPEARLGRPVLEGRGLEEASRAAEEGFDRLAQVTAGTAQVIEDREAFRRLVASVFDVDDVAEQYRRVDTAMSGLVDAGARARGWGDLVDADAELVEQARDAFRQAIRHAEGAKGTRPEPAVAGVFETLGLEPVQTGRMTAARPPELDATMAPAMMRSAVEKFYRLRDDPSALEEVVNRFYRPYLAMFKATATVGRGPGFHVRNVFGGSWNNYVIDSTAQDAKLASQLAIERRRAGRAARSEAARELSQRQSIPVDRARRQVSDESVTGRAEELLRERLGAVKVTDDLTLYDVHRMGRDHEIGWRSRAQEQVHTLAEGQPQPGQQAARAHRVGTLDRFLYPDEPSRRMRARAAHVYDLFPGEDDPSALQRLSNRVVNTWWVRQNVGLSELSEDYLRYTAFITGLRRYGADDGGRTATMLVRATQFDYADLSDFERRYMRGALFPFYTWSRRNVPLQWRALWQEPGKMNRLFRASDAAREAFGADDQDLVPEWMQENLGFVSTFTFGGNPLVLGIEAPATDLNRFIKPSQPISGFARAAASNLSPVVGQPIQAMTGRDLFTGASLEPGAGRVAPAWYRALPGVPTWTDGRGEVRGDARMIGTLESMVPWLGQSGRVAGIAGIGPRAERGATDAIRQLLPIVQASTLTPGQAAGELATRTGRLRRQTARVDAELVAEARALLERGFTPDQVRALLAASAR